MPSFMTTRAPLAQTSNANPLDVVKIKSALSALGAYQTPDWGLSQFPDAELFRAIKAFQKAQGLKTDGIIKPDGETLAALQEKLKGDKARTQAQTAALALQDMGRGGDEILAHITPEEAQQELAKQKEQAKQEAIAQKAAAEQHQQEEVTRAQSYASMTQNEQENTLSRMLGTQSTQAPASGQNTSNAAVTAVPAAQIFSAIAQPSQNATAATPVSPSNRPNKLAGTPPGMTGSATPAQQAKNVRAFQAHQVKVADQQAKAQKAAEKQLTQNVSFSFASKPQMYAASIQPAKKDNTLFMGKMVEGVEDAYKTGEKFVRSVNHYASDLFADVNDRATNPKRTNYLDKRNNTMNPAMRKQVAREIGTIATLRSIGGGLKISGAVQRNLLTGAATGYTGDGFLDLADKKEKDWKY